jgi:hypothetical protein
MLRVFIVTGGALKKTNHENAKHEIYHENTKERKLEKRTKLFFDFSCFGVFVIQMCFSFSTFHAFVFS